MDREPLTEGSFKNVLDKAVESGSLARFGQAFLIIGVNYILNNLVFKLNPEIYYIYYNEKIKSKIKVDNYIEYRSSRPLGLIELYRKILIFVIRRTVVVLDWLGHRYSGCQIYSPLPSSLFLPNKYRY